MCGTLQLLTASSLLLLRCAEASASMKASREKPPADDPAELPRQVRQGLDLRAMAAASSCMPCQQACLPEIGFTAVTSDMAEMGAKPQRSPSAASEDEREALQAEVTHVEHAEVRQRRPCPEWMLVRGLTCRGHHNEMLHALPLSRPEQVPEAPCADDRSGTPQCCLERLAIACAVANAHM